MVELIFILSFDRSLIGMRRYVAEFVSTFFLVLVGTGSIILDQATNGKVGILGIALSFGGIIALMIILFERVSGAHMNPAVTLAKAINKDTNWSNVIPYTLFQFLGAIAASITLKLMVPANDHLGVTLPRGSVSESFWIEFAMTFILMSFVLIADILNEKSSNFVAATIIGIGIVPLILYSGRISGGSFNPARTFGPALIAQNFQALWIYFIATTLGACLAVLLFRVFDWLKKKESPNS